MIKKIIRGFFALFLVQFLLACGGSDDTCKFNDSCSSSSGGTGGTGGTGGGTGGGVTSGITIKMTSKATGLEVSTVDAAVPVDIVASVTGITSPLIASFTSDKAVLSDAVTKAPLTDGKVLLKSGSAAVELAVNDGASGAGEIKVSVTTADGEVLTASKFFEITTPPRTLELKLLSSVTGLETTYISLADPGRLVATVAGQTKPVIVNFVTNKGSVSNSGSILTNSAGVAEVDLSVDGGAGAGTVTATTRIGTMNLSGTVDFEIKATNTDPEVAGVHLQFASAEPESIALQGSGGALQSETSVVEFKVLDGNSTPVSDREVTFSLNSTSGGIVLDPVTATSGSNGTVRTTIRSGTVATTVRVTATVIDDEGKASSVQSSRLVISSGIPDQDSFSLAASVLNPEAWSINGVPVVLTVNLADGFNNPVPDGTAVSFTAEGGTIQPSCTTLGGTCNVQWISSNPRPENGRVTVTATAIGEESFPDSNGNGRFDANEKSSFLNAKDLSGNSFDLAEMFTDYNEDGIYNPTEAGGRGVANNGGLEKLIDFNANGLWDDKDGLYNGSLCSIPLHDGCSVSQKTLTIGKDIVLVMSSGDQPPTVSLQLLPGNSAELCYGDFHNQPLPAGTEIKFNYKQKDDDGKEVTKSKSYKQMNTNVGNVASDPNDDARTCNAVVDIKGDATEMSVSFKMPSGIEWEILLL